MTKGPRGRTRLTNIGPFTYDETSPPEVPRGFSPPKHIDNARGDFRWWDRFPPGNQEKAATILYDPKKDRVFIENRINGPEGGQYTHDDMVVDIIEKSPFGKVPNLLLPGEAGAIKLGGGLNSTLNLPTIAGGAWVVTERLDEKKDFIESGERVKVEWFYKIVYTLKMIEFPDSATVVLKHKLGPRANTVFEADRKFFLEDAYRELQFEGMLPDSKVS